MVSIPDWTKFSRTVEGLKKPHSSQPLNKFFYQQEQVALREAEEQGYFLVPSCDYILKYLGPCNAMSKSIKQIFLVKLDGVHMQKLGDISLCTNLQICILANNFLTNVDALARCYHLVKLDLHGNQMSSIPDPIFWSGLKKLRALYLHDNPLGNLETLQNLTVCRCLTILTLYDTPLYLRKNYRHYVVNSIWTLKALDHHVISDEEIIEDAFFRGHFSALCPPFRLDLWLASSNNTTYQEELKLLQKLEACINRILARNSPVIIIQRYFRGYITRKKLGLVPNRKPHSGKIHEGPHLLPLAVSTEGQPRAESHQPITEIRRTPVWIVPPSSPVHLLASDIFPPSLTSDKKNESPSNIIINFRKLQNNITEMVHSHAIHNPDLERLPHLSNIPAGQRRTEKCRNEKRPPTFVKTGKQSFGYVVETGPEDNMDKIFDKEDFPFTVYRLQGRKYGFFLSDATTDMILEKVASGKQVREVRAEWMEMAKAESPPKIPHNNFTTNKQRLFARVYGTMSLSCLLAVQKAYQDRENAEKLTAKKEHVKILRDERQRAKESIQFYLQQKRIRLMHKQDLDQASLLDQLEKKELQQLNYLDRQHEAKGWATAMTRSHYANKTFMTEFNSQHTSVSNALLRHDRQAKNEDKNSSQRTKVQNLRSDKHEQQEMVKKYLEHRQLMRQTEASLARTALDSHILQETTDRLMEAKQRVAHIKAKEATVQAFYPLPPNVVSGLEEAETRPLQGSL